MIFYTGHDVIYNNEKYHIQDTDYLNLMAKIGIPDENDLIWETKWVAFKDLKNMEA